MTSNYDDFSAFLESCDQSALDASNLNFLKSSNKSNHPIGVSKNQSYQAQILNHHSIVKSHLRPIPRDLQDRQFRGLGKASSAPYLLSSSQHQAPKLTLQERRQLSRNLASEAESSSPPASVSPTETGRIVKEKEVGYLKDALMAEEMNCLVKGNSNSASLWSHLLLDNSHDLVYVLSLKWTFLYVSPSSERILGFKPKEMLGKNLSEFCSPSDFGQVSRQLKDSTSGPSVGSANAIRLLLRMRHKTEGYVWIESDGKVDSEDAKKIVVATGRPRPVYELAKDASERAHWVDSDSNSSPIDVFESGSSNSWVYEFNQLKNSNRRLKESLSFLNMKEKALSPPESLPAFSSPESIASDETNLFDADRFEGCFGSPPSDHGFRDQVSSPNPKKRKNVEDFSSDQVFKKTSMSPLFF